jgi:hypothetical protein
MIDLSFIANTLAGQGAMRPRTVAPIEEAEPITSVPNFATRKRDARLTTGLEEAAPVMVAGQQMPRMTGSDIQPQSPMNPRGFVEPIGERPVPITEDYPATSIAEAPNRVGRSLEVRPTKGQRWKNALLAAAHSFAHGGGLLGAGAAAWEGARASQGGPGLMGRYGDYIEMDEEDTNLRRQDAQSARQSARDKAALETEESRARIKLQGAQAGYYEQRPDIEAAKLESAEKIANTRAQLQADRDARRQAQAYVRMLAANGDQINEDLMEAAFGPDAAPLTPRQRYAIVTAGNGVFAVNPYAPRSDYQQLAGIEPKQAEAPRPTEADYDALASSKFGKARGTMVPSQFYDEPGEIEEIDRAAAQMAYDQGAIDSPGAWGTLSNEGRSEWISRYGKKVGKPILVPIEETAPWQQYIAGERAARLQGQQNRAPGAAPQQQRPPRAEAEAEARRRFPGDPQSQAAFLKEAGY